MTKNFRLRGNKLFLTYPKNDILSSKTVVHQNIKNFFLSKKSRIELLITSFETSDEDHPYEHFHIYMRLDRRIDLKSPRSLDILGVHGCYQKLIKSEAEAIKYVTKDGDFLIDGDIKPLLKKSRLTSAQLIQLLKEKILQMKTWKRFEKYHHLSKHEVIKKVLTNLESHIRIEILLNKKNILNALNEELSLNYSWWKSCPKYKLSDFNVPPAFIEWARRHKNRLTCVITGPSGKGKTQLALSAFQNPLLVSHTDTLKQLNDSNDGIVFDDMNFSHWPTESLIHLTDLEESRGINVKGDIANLPSELPRIITSNKQLEEIFPVDPHGAIKRRIYAVVISPNWILF